MKVVITTIPNGADKVQTWIIDDLINKSLKFVCTIYEPSKTVEEVFHGAIRDR